MRNVKVFKVDLATTLGAIFGKLRQAAMTRDSETRMAREMRAIIQETLTKVVRDCKLDGSFPFRTGKAYAKTLNGARAYGTRFTNLRGHIMGPASIKLMEEGGTIYPKNASALTIPLPAALRPDGTPKLPGPRSWKNIKKTFLWKSKRTERFYIVYKDMTQPEGKQFVFLYVLVDEAEFKAKRFLQAAWNRNKFAMMAEFGNIMIAEFSRVDLLQLARVTTKGASK